jgi:hypothetical protein
MFCCVPCGTLKDWIYCLICDRPVHVKKSKYAEHIKYHHPLLHNMIMVNNYKDGNKLEFRHEPLDSFTYNQVFFNIPCACKCFRYV